MIHPPGRSCCFDSAVVPSPPLIEAPHEKQHGRAGSSPRLKGKRDEKSSPSSHHHSSRGWARFTQCAVLVLTLAGPLGAMGQEDGSSNSTPGEDEDAEDSSVLGTIVNFLVVIVLVAASGLFSGLTLGLLGLDKIGLEIISHGDEPRMAAFAKKIQPVRADGNLLLCTLLLGNVAVNALLSIVMAQLTSGLVGFALATVIITIFGEIIPQAVCSRHALRIGSKVVPLVKGIIFLLYPITKPLSLMLDKMLGDEIGTIHSRKELSELLKIHVEHGAIDVETGREVAGAMNYKEHTVREVMTPVKDCFMLSVSEKLNFKTLSVIFKSGFSRIPVFAKDRNDVIGLLFTKDLIFIDPDDETPLKNFVQIFGRAVTVVWPDFTLGDVLKVFKQGKSHLSLVRDVNDAGEGDPFYEVVGIITLEDIIEEILGDEIVDETDAFVDMQNQLPVQRGQFDMSRLQLLNANADKSALSTDEAKAVASHLMANVPQQFEGINVSHVESIIAASPVVEVSKEDKHTGRSEPAPAEVLYRRGRTSTMCTLILTGKVVVLAGRDGFRSDAGPWTVLGADALVEDEGAYKPDFSAHAGSERLRCVRISKASFDTVMSMSKQEEEEPHHASRVGPHGGGNTDGNNTVGSGNNNAGATGYVRKSGPKPRAFSDEGSRHQADSATTGSVGAVGAGTKAAGRKTLSPSKFRRGLPTGASLKILQAATGVSMTTSSTTSTPMRGRHTEDKPLEAQEASPREDTGTGASAVGANGTAEETGISMVAATHPDPSSRVSGDGTGDAESNRPPEDDAQEISTPKTSTL
ncbi:unnamed protein product [Ectocarpus sp. 12 AP-2014]